jgi:hypothetical protein
MDKLFSYALVAGQVSAAVVAAVVAVLVIIAPRTRTLKDDAALSLFQRLLRGLQSLLGRLVPAGVVEARAAADVAKARAGGK